mgnify:FL=1
METLNILQSQDPNRSMHMLIFEKAVQTLNQIYIHACQFIRMFLIHSYNQTQQVPVITLKFIDQAFGTVSYNSSGNVPNQEMQNFYDAQYVRILPTKIYSYLLTQPLQSSVQEVYTNFNNHIEEHFMAFIVRFVKKQFHVNKVKFTENLTKKQRHRFYQHFNQQISNIVDDILNNTSKFVPRNGWGNNEFGLQSAYAYQTYIHNFRGTYIPEYKQITRTSKGITTTMTTKLTSKSDYESHVRSYASDYTIYMIRMCKWLEQHAFKVFEIFPQRSSTTPKYFTFDTSAVSTLFGFQSLVRKDLIKYRDLIWSHILDMQHPIFTARKNRSKKVSLERLERQKKQFHYTIDTDGVSVSISMITKEAQQLHDEGQRNKLNERNKTFQIRNQMNDEEYKEFQKNKKETQKAVCDQKRQEFNDKKRKFSEDLKAKQAEHNQLAKNLKIDKTNPLSKVPMFCNEDSIDEFKYIDDLSIEKQTSLLERQLVFADGGKRTLLHCIGMEKKTEEKKEPEAKKDEKKEEKQKNNKHRLDEESEHRYTNGQRRFDSCVEMFDEILKQRREEYGITQAEQQVFEVPNQPSAAKQRRSIDNNNYEEYLLKKSQLYHTLHDKYNSRVFRSLRMERYRKSQSQQRKFVEWFERCYGKTSVLIVGDWSMRSNNLKGSQATPGRSLNRLLRKNGHEVYLIDEFRTSLIHYATLEAMGNLYLPDKTGVYRKMHSIRTYQMVSLNGQEGEGCIDRDRSAVRNMRRLAIEQLKGQQRTILFTNWVTHVKVIESLNALNKRE